jgi:hypothetical protein
MFSFIKKIWHTFLFLLLALIFSYFLLFLFLHPINLAFFAIKETNAAGGITNTASVPENPINQLAMKLDEKQAELDQREQTLNSQESALASQSKFWNNSLLLAIFLALGVLGVLVMINFYYDRRREKELEILAEREMQETVLVEERK